MDQYGEEWEEHGELWSPKQPDNAVMGSSVLWRSYEEEKPQDFPDVPWAMPVARDYAKVKGEWQWEFSRNDLNQIDDAEEIRDHMLRAIYGSFGNCRKTPIANWNGYPIWSVSVNPADWLVITFLH